jgi:hypothetical protein
MVAGGVHSRFVEGRGTPLSRSRHWGYVAGMYAGCLLRLNREIRSQARPANCWLGAASQNQKEHIRWEADMHATRAAGRSSLGSAHSAAAGCSLPAPIRICGCYSPGSGSMRSKHPLFSPGPAACHSSHAYDLISFSLGGAALCRGRAHVIIRWPRQWRRREGDGAGRSRR